MRCSATTSLTYKGEYLEKVIQEHVPGESSEEKVAYKEMFKIYSENEHVLLSHYYQIKSEDR